jgi:hypothetical protein
MAHDMLADPARSGRTMQLVSSLHLQKEPDGGGLAIDDRTLMVAHLNAAAYILLEALRRPRTQEELVTILAQEANCGTGDSVAPVAQLIDELTEFKWIEFSGDVADTRGSTSLPTRRTSPGSRSAEPE